jgi:hypothetical protein
MNKIKKKLQTEISHPDQQAWMSITIKAEISHPNDPPQAERRELQISFEHPGYRMK